MENKRRTKEKTALSNVKRLTEFNDLIEKVITGNNQLTLQDKNYFLTNIMIILKIYDQDHKFLNYFNFAYYLLLKYSLLTEDYKPLYDLSLQSGLYPVCDLIIETKKIEFENPFDYANYHLMKKKYYNSHGQFIETFEQNKIFKQFLSNVDNYAAIIAPTSYGKSSVIENYIIKYKPNKIGIIVPSKSLLIQTYKSLKKLSSSYKLVIHDEMYNSEKRIIAVLTQERALRLLKKLSFDVLFIDEAHNILDFGLKDKSIARSINLARVIIHNEKTNPNTKVFYLSPVVNDPNSLLTKKTPDLKAYKIQKNIKSEDYFYYHDGNVELYNRFTGEFYFFEEVNGFYRYIIEKSETKNFIYTYRPIKVEQLAEELYENIEHEHYLPELEEISLLLSEKIHKNFKGVKYIKKGIIYLHGNIPDNVKEFLEYKFKTVKSIKYLIGNSVILEGVNLPIDTIFITDTNCLTQRKMTNLIGRANRLSYLVKSKKIHKLIPKIHFIENHDYQKKGTMRKKIKLLHLNFFDDNIKNPLLINYDIDSHKFKDDVKQKYEKINNEIITSTRFITQNINEDLYSTIKKSCINNNISNFYSDPEKLYTSLFKNIYDLKENQYLEEDNIINEIYTFFIKELYDYIDDYQVKRLDIEKARSYYTHFILVSQKKSLVENVAILLKYFIRVSKTSQPYIYIGNKFGEDYYQPEKGVLDYRRQPQHIKITSNLSTEKLVNIAVIKLQLEENFVNYVIKKFITFFNDLNLISLDQYNNLTYGTNDPEILSYLKLGIKINIINELIQDKQLQNIKVDTNGNVLYTPKLHEYLKDKDEFFQFQVKNFL